MLSLNNLYYILYTLLFKHINISPIFFYPFGRTDPEAMQCYLYDETHRVIGTPFCLFYDQEPLLEKNVDRVFANFVDPYTTYICILANSEVSSIKPELCEKYGLVDFYYFFHGLLALYWFNDARYYKQINHPIQNDFLTMNHLCTEDRSYRLTLVAELIENDIIDHGSVSLHLFNDTNNTLKTELFNANSKLSKDAKKLIYKNIFPLSSNLVLDKENVQGWMSSDFDYTVYKLWQSSFFHIVTETVFYYDKLHLTEKIFKPIVARRPFFLCAAPGNLAYLRRYGFKTFDRWIDESYDLEHDNDLRIKKIVAEVKRITEMSANAKDEMYKEMIEVLDYNFNHFNNDFKEIVVDELLKNYESCITQLNLKDNNQFDLSTINFESVKQILIS